MPGSCGVTLCPGTIWIGLLDPEDESVTMMTRRGTAHLPDTSPYTREHFNPYPANVENMVSS